VFSNMIRYIFRQNNTYTGRSKSLYAPVEKLSVFEQSPQVDDLKMAVTEYIRNVDRAILNTVFESTVRRVNTFLDTGGGHVEHYLQLSVL
jgi:hypothetical protein